MKPELQFSKFRKIKLPNGIIGSEDYKKKLNLPNLNKNLEHNKIFKPQYDLDSNPSQNYVMITIQNLDEITGNFWVYSNGTVCTNIGLKDDIIISLLDFFYKLYGRESLEN